MNTFCTNLRTEEMTQYDNFDFLAFGRLGKQVYGLKADGIYALGGNDDAGTRIDCEATTHQNGFGEDIGVHTKWAYTAYVEGDSRPIGISPYADGNRVGTYYGADRVKLARGARARYWAFKLQNVGGNDLKVTAFEVLIDIKRRKK